MSVKYRKISPRIWSDAKFMSLSDDGQLLFLFVLTHPHMTSVGAMRASTAGLSSEKKWPLQKAVKGFAELFRKGLLEYDESTSSLVAPNFVKYNPPENTNVVKSWRKAFDELPESEIINQHYQRVKLFLEEYNEPFAEPFKEPFRKSMPIQEQEQEQEQEQDKRPLSDSANAKSGRPVDNATFKKQAIEVLEFLNKKTGRRYRLTDPNLKLIIARLKTRADVSDCKAVIAKKCREWLPNPDQAIYLRPKTLFNATNFEQYVGELLADDKPEEVQNV